MEQLSYVFTQYFVVCVHVRFYFSLPLIFDFILLAASISHFFTAAMFFSLQNTSPLFSITRSSSFSVNHVRIKNNAEKDKTFFLFFLSKSPGGHVKTWVAFGLPYLLIELLYIGIRADKGWAVKRARPSKKVWCSGLGLCLDSASVRACDVVCTLDTAAVTELWRLDLFSCTSSSFLCAGTLSPRGKCCYFLREV